MRNTNFNALARPTAFEVARTLANRDDAIKPYSPPVVPDLKYPTSKDWSPTSVVAFIRSFAP